MKNESFLNRGSESGKIGTEKKLCTHVAHTFCSSSFMKATMFYIILFVVNHYFCVCASTLPLDPKEVVINKFL